MKKIKWNERIDVYGNKEYEFGNRMEWNKYYFEITFREYPYNYFSLTAWDGSDRSYHRFKKLSSAKKVAELIMFG